ncbi:hypothetical protein yc1106_07413 [Curvularia clavata]|uniref:Rhodopsin domain-containing protein n=1 Tax=Curvularia clavata TaxID=95742 RepID=A0A9Q9DVR8_CURCL|nr:hypothetical protein yc1106_07413 [Curvularia clavata]
MHTTIPIENGQQMVVILTCSISIFIAFVAVALRLVAKKIRNRIDGSDYCIIVACLWNAALHGTGISLVTYGGFGFHTAEILQRFGPSTLTYFYKGIMTFSMLWNATMCFSKLSVLLMYSALIPTPTMIRTTIGFGAFIVVWCIANIMAAFLICRPLVRNWDFSVPGTCGSQPDFYFTMGIINLITDAVLIGLPMPYLYKLAMPMRKKLIAMALLSVGIGWVDLSTLSLLWLMRVYRTWAITIYRQTTLTNLNFADMTYEGVLATVLSGLEPAVAIVLACVPLMRPLFAKSRHSMDTDYQYGSSRQTTFTLKKNRSHGLDPTATFSELTDGTNSSQIELRPVEGVQRVCISSDEERSQQEKALSPRTISVERKWEVRRGNDLD